MVIRIGFILAVVLALLLAWAESHAWVALLAAAAAIQAVFQYGYDAGQKWAAEHARDLGWLAEIRRAQAL